MPKPYPTETVCWSARATQGRDRRENAISVRRAKRHDRVCVFIEESPWNISFFFNKSGFEDSGRRPAADDYRNLRKD
jgi:hypothetical protein